MRHFCPGTHKKPLLLLGYIELDTVMPSHPLLTPWPRMAPGSLSLLETLNLGVCQHVTKLEPWMDRLASLRTVTLTGSGVEALSVLNDLVDGSLPLVTTLYLSRCGC